MVLFKHASDVVINDPTVFTDPQICDGNVAMQLGDGIIYCLGGMGIHDSNQ